MSDRFHFDVQHHRSMIEQFLHSISNFYSLDLNSENIIFKNRTKCSPGWKIVNFFIAIADCTCDIDWIGLSSKAVSALCHRPGLVGIGVGLSGLFKSNIFKPYN